MNNFYVYVHKRKDNNEIFYVGKGVGYRLDSKQNRSKGWWNIVDQFGFYSEVVFDKLTEDVALSKEEELINNHSNVIVNKISKNFVKELPAALLEHYTYNELAPSCLTRNTTVNKWLKDETAGSKRKSGYWYVQFGDKLYAAHRIVYEKFNGKIPIGFVVNHIDGDTSNNKIGNLECVSKSVNSFKSKTQKKENCGVYEKIDKDRQGNLVYSAYANWCENGKQKGKRFYYKDHLSKEQAWSEAIAYRKFKIEGVYRGI